jgi:hypothetical protein
MSCKQGLVFRNPETKLGLLRLWQGSATFSLPRAALAIHIFVAGHRKKLMSWTASETVFLLPNNNKNRGDYANKGHNPKKTVLGSSLGEDGFLSPAAKLDSSCEPTPSVAK